MSDSQARNLCVVCLDCCLRCEIIHASACSWSQNRTRTRHTSLPWVPASDPYNGPIFWRLRCRYIQCEYFCEKNLAASSDHGSRFRTAMRSPFLQRGYRYVQCGCVVKRQLRSNMTAHDAWRFAGPAAVTGPAAPGFRLVFAMHCCSHCIRLVFILAHSLGPAFAFNWHCDMCGAKKLSPEGSRTSASRFQSFHVH